ncbi:MAG: hypothetical protein AAFQ42_04175 [Pseudomonadota bacterium]
MARLTLETAKGAAIVPSLPTAETLFELGLMYSAGRDCDPDMIKAHKWFNLAAQRGKAEARTLRIELSKEMTRREISEAQRQAREWLRKH